MLGAFLVFWGRFMGCLSVLVASWGGGGVGDFLGCVGGILGGVGGNFGGCWTRIVNQLLQSVWI